VATAIAVVLFAVQHQRRNQFGRRFNDCC